jgi:hypothetical protein
MGLEVYTQSCGAPKSWESQFWEFRDSHLKVLGQNAIWMWALWRGTKYNLKGKVMASFKFGPWWVLWIQVCPWLILAPKVLELWIDQLCRNPTLAKCGGEAQHLEKSEDLESSEILECSELDSKARSTSHWGVLGVIGKFLKRRYRKWPRIGHLDIYSPSYGPKKGRESNWQFDSRPQKVGNRPLPDLRIESAIRRWKDLNEGYKFGLDFVAIRPGSRELWPLKVPGLHPRQFRDSNLWVLGKRAIWM